MNRLDFLSNKPDEIVEKKASEPSRPNGKKWVNPNTGEFIAVDPAYDGDHTGTNAPRPTQPDPYHDDFEQAYRELNSIQRSEQATFSVLDREARNNIDNEYARMARIGEEMRRRQLELMQRANRSRFSDLEIQSPAPRPSLINRVLTRLGQIAS